MVNSRFKFRAWDKENEVMIYPKGVLFDGRVVNFSCGMLESFEGYELMQCTGLYDKNGKGIYEGDIVRFHYKTGVYKIGTVVWNDLFGSWDIDCSDFVSYKSLGQYKSVSEVIGNIYENPELLEESK